MLMQRMALIELQAQLDEAYAHNPDSSTLADFRADPLLVEAEARALDEAVEIISPHPGVVGGYPAKARILDWALPKVERVHRGPREPGCLRLWLPTSTVARKGVWELTEVEAVSIPEGQIENLRAALGGRSEELVAVEVKYKLSPSLRRILKDPAPEEQDLAAAAEKCVERKRTLRHVFRSA